MNKAIQIYEFDTLYLGQFYLTVEGENVKFERRYFDPLLKFNDLHHGKYFSPVFEGIRFKSYVGVIQVDDLVIEILPKIDRVKLSVNWRDVLIEMLQTTDQLKVHQVNNAMVDKQSYHLLDIYFDLFLQEIEKLIHHGLIKQYYKETKNSFALKGKLEFAGHIRQNLVHQERFYTSHQVYDKDHLIHQILQLALSIIEKLSKGTYRYGHCKSVQLNFPEVQDILVNEYTFTRIKSSRKTEPYGTALAMARLIILKYSPNVRVGKENMLALLFNMNSLWEQYVLIKLQRATKDWLVNGQESKRFWQTKTMRPDIILKHKDTGERFIIDTKWKNYSYDRISSDDLRQIYVYSDYWNATGGMLLYPSPSEKCEIIKKGNYEGKKYIGMLGLVSVLNEQGKLNQDIGWDILKMFNE